jgi:hypothetical protein
MIYISNFIKICSGIIKFDKGGGYKNTYSMVIA